MKLFEKFLNSTLNQRKVLETYLELRKYFQELGWSEKDLKNPREYTEKLMTLRGKFSNENSSLFKQLNDYGFNVTNEEYMEYLQPLLHKIDELTPLAKNGNNERTDSWDEDFE